jgi:hypothetical protein
MRHGTTNNNRRQRSRGNNGGRNGHKGNQGRTQVFDSNGPDVRIRGTAHQVYEKYVALAKDAASIGDIIVAENYSQHAEHYQRIINSWADDVQTHRQSDHQGQRSSVPVRSESQADGDLSLPVSILGSEPQVEHEVDVVAADDLMPAS